MPQSSKLCIREETIKVYNTVEDIIAELVIGVYNDTNDTFFHVRDTDVLYVNTPTGLKSAFDSFLNLKNMGAIGDGIADDTMAIQMALFHGCQVYVPKGRYRVTKELVWSTGSVLFSGGAPYFVQNIVNQPDIEVVPEIFYDGLGGALSCVCRLSKKPVGIQPGYMPDESESLKGAGIIGIYINGNNLAEYGIYSARAGLGSICRDNVVTKTLKHGFWFGAYWSANISNIFAIHNQGCGVSIGIDTFGWVGGNVANNINLCNIVADYNGLSLTDWTQSDFLSGYGIGLGLARACEATNIDAEHNYGIGLYLAPTSGPSSIKGIYVENNCKIAASTADRFQIWYQSTVNAFNQTLSDIYALYNIVAPSGNTNAPRIKITGALQTPFKVGNVLKINGVVGNIVIDADYNEYRLEGYAFSSGIRFVNRFPHYSDPNTINDAANTVLYCNTVVSGNGNGQDASNYCLIEDAIKTAAVVSTITTIDYSAATGTSSPIERTIDGSNIYRDLIIDGLTTGKLPNYATSNIAANIINWSTKLTIKNMAIVERTNIVDSIVEFVDCPLIRTGANNLLLAALILAGSDIDINGTSVINVSNSTAATKTGVTVGKNSSLNFNDAAAGTIVSHTPGYAIEFGYGSGIVRTSITTVTGTWAATANVSRIAGGMGGMVMAPDGLNP